MSRNIVAVQFERLGKKYYFSADNFSLEIGDPVVVETVRGMELGYIVKTDLDVSDDDIVSPLKPIVRLATEQDLLQYQQNKEQEPEIMETTAKLVKKHHLEMKLLNCEYTLDKSRLIIYFTADGRVDFRNLVKDLANTFHVRIELRQVGARDGAKVLGGIGPCGMLTCCTTFLGDFQPVTIKMAKNQNLSLNPGNISGLCGKLMCCIRYEDDNYREYRKTMPKVGSMVTTVDGEAKVTNVNYISQVVTVRFDDGNMTSYPISDLTDRKQQSTSRDRSS